jgi:hypothetical protein
MLALGSPGDELALPDGPDDERLATGGPPDA